LIVDLALGYFAPGKGHKQSNEDKYWHPSSSRKCWP